MERPIYLLLAILLFYVIFKMMVPECNCDKPEHMLGSVNQAQAQAQDPNDINITINTEKYSQGGYGYGYGHGCDSYHCRNRSPWYGDTPFPWGNGTRYPRWGWPYYAHIHNWYRDTYAWPWPYYY